MAADCPVDAIPYSQSGEIKTPNIFNLNYTNQDFWSMKARLIDFVQERFGPDGTVLPNTFNDLVESSIAIMLIENWAFLADALSFKMDQIANEIFIDTVTEVENIFRLAKLVGFQPQPPIAASSMWSATITQVLVTDLAIEAPIAVDIVSDDTPTRIELFPADANDEPIFDEDIIIPAGDLVTTSIVGLEGRTITEEFEGTGEVAQTLSLSFNPVIYNSVRIQVDGVTWDNVDYFTDSQPRREYRVEFNSDYNGFVIFGNNRAGMIPADGSRIIATYRIGGGTVGNIVTNFIETQRQAVVPGLEINVPITYTNYTRGQYGYNGDGIEDVRRKLPTYLRTQDRAVTGSDYQTLADQFATEYHGQVGKATAVLRNHGCAGNIIDIYILALDGDDLVDASNGLKVDLNEAINEKKMLTDYVCIRDGVVISTDVTVDIVADRSLRKFETELRENVTRRINSFFSLNNWQYAKTLRANDLVKEISTIKELETIDITFTTDDEDNSGELVTAKFYEIIRPDTITISFMFTS